MRPTVLGLDIGTNSIGWALLALDDQGQPCDLVDAGVRIFSQAVDAKTHAPLNAERRRLRGLRRQIARKAQRKQLVRGILTRTGLWPVEVASDPKPEGALNRIGDPLRLRAEGLDRPLTAHEFGRALFHLAVRRGFRSNRKSSKPDDEKEQEGLLAGIAALEATLRTEGVRTLGEWLHRRASDGQPHRNRLGIRVTASSRAMAEHEFNALWKAQALHHANICTPALQVALRRAIFLQRPLKSPPRQVRCIFEAARGRIRSPASWAWPLAQRFRFWQELNHLRILDPITQEQRPLNLAARVALGNELETKEKLSWSAVRRILKKVWQRDVLEEERFSREDSIEHLTGNVTACRLRGTTKKPVLEHDWDTLNEWLTKHGSERLKYQVAQRRRESDQQHQPQSDLDLIQDLLITDLLTIGDSHRLEDGADALLTRLQQDWGFDLHTAMKLAGVRLEERPGRVSLTAMRRILPHLITGLDILSAASAAGYPRQDQLHHEASIRLYKPAPTRNPVVDRALGEVGVVVNALLRVHGRPTAIRVEMARDLKQSKQDRFDDQLRMREQRLRNQQAEDWWKGMGVEQPNHDHRLKFRLWQELEAETGGCCPYTGVKISAAMLGSEAVHIEHIIPYARCLDDSFANKTLCIADANTEKGNRTPWEWLVGNQARYAAILDRISRLKLTSKRCRFHPPSAWRFLDEHRRATFKPGDSLIDDFTTRQLNDTRWIARVARGWLLSLYPSHNIQDIRHSSVTVCRGASTALLRRVWDLNRCLSVDGTKNRADHRQHATDAVVIACTDPGLYARLSHVAQGRLPDERLIRTLARLPPPWPGLAPALSERLQRLVVSHAVQRRISGGFHEDTAYGLQGEEDGQLIFHYRKRLDATFKQFDDIVDPIVQQHVKAHLAAHGGDTKTAFAGAHPCLHVDRKTPIRTVRIRTTFSPTSVMARNRDGHAVAHYKLGNNHHLELWRETNGKVTGQIVTTWSAAQRVRTDHLPLYPIENDPARTYIGSLTINDTVEVPSDPPKYVRVQKMSEGVIAFRSVEAATLDDDADRLFKAPASFVKAGMRKVFVDPLGRVMSDDQAPRRDRPTSTPPSRPPATGGTTP